MSTDSRVVVIAGATGQLGRALAAAFADDGHPVVVLGRDQAELDELVAGLAGGSSKHAGIVADPADPSALARAAGEARERGSGTGILLDAIGGYRGSGGIVDSEDAELETMLAAHVRSAWNLLRAFLPDVREADGGRIVTFSATSAGSPGASAAAYAASKAALEALTLSVAKELAKTRATANVVVLRSIGTEKPTETSPEEIVAAVRWLCSREADAMNGQRIPLVGRA